MTLTAIYASLANRGDTLPAEVSAEAYAALDDGVYTGITTVLVGQAAFGTYRYRVRFTPGGQPVEHENDFVTGQLAIESWETLHEQHKTLKDRFILAELRAGNWFEYPEETEHFRQMAALFTGVDDSGWTVNGM